MRMFFRLVLIITIPLALIPSSGSASEPLPAATERDDRCERRPERPRCAVTTTTTTSVPPSTTTTSVPPTTTTVPPTTTTTAPPPTTTTTSVPPTTTTTQPPVSDLWTPAPGTTWHWQLTGSLDFSVDVDVYDIDLFDVDAQDVAELKASGIKTICYVSVGSWEDWRPDAAAFPAEVLGASNGWPGEKWLDIRQIDVLAPIMEARLDLCVDKGFDAVEPDNVDGYANNSGFPLTKADQIAYLEFLATAAHERGLSIGLKNSVELVDDVVGSFDFAVNEECAAYNECAEMSPFIDAGKAVFHVEYELRTSQFCSATTALGFSSMKKNWDLDAWSEPCW